MHTDELDFPYRVEYDTYDGLIVLGLMDHDDEPVLDGFEPIAFVANAEVEALMYEEQAA
jgi:hypothetical protein